MTRLKFSNFHVSISKCIISVTGRDIINLSNLKKNLIQEIESKSICGKFFFCQNSGPKFLEIFYKNTRLYSSERPFGRFVLASFIAEIIRSPSKLYQRVMQYYLLLRI